MKSPVRLGRSVLVFGRNGSFASLCRAPKCGCSRARCAIVALRPDPATPHRSTPHVASIRGVTYNTLLHLCTQSLAANAVGFVVGRVVLPRAVSATGSPICRPSRSSGPIALPSHGPPHCAVDARTQGGAIPTQPSLRIYGYQFRNKSPYRLSPLITCQFPSS